MSSFFSSQFICICLSLSVYPFYSIWLVNIVSYSSDSPLATPRLATGTVSLQFSSIAICDPFFCQELFHGFRDYCSTGRTLLDRLSPVSHLYCPLQAAVRPGPLWESYLSFYILLYSCVLHSSSLHSSSIMATADSMSTAA